MGSVLGVGVQGKAVLSIHRAETATKGEAVVDVHSPVRGRMAAVEGPWGRECLAAARCEAGTEQVSHHTVDNPGCNKDPTWLSGDVGDRGNGAVWRGRKSATKWQAQPKRPTRGEESKIKKSRLPMVEEEEIQDKLGRKVGTVVVVAVAIFRKSTLA